MATTVESPGRDGCFSSSSGRSEIYTGMRCTIWMKLPVALSGASRAKTLSEPYVDGTNFAPAATNNGRQEPE